MRAHSALLLEMQYDTRACSRAELARAHWEWADAHVGRVRKVGSVAPARSETGARLRIGYLSPRFGNGPLANLFLPVLEAHDRGRFHVTLYSAHAYDDDIAATHAAFRRRLARPSGR